MANPPGRNDPCPCNSGVKHKHCCGKGRGPGLSEPEGVRRATDRLFDLGSCLHPEVPSGCDGSIIKAHTIPRSGGLARIAVDGHVLSVELVDNLGSGRPPEFRPKLVGIGIASTFRGFCGIHDRETFAPIETRPFTGTQEQTFLLGYRALCHEVLLKRIQCDAIPLERRVRDASLRNSSAFHSMLGEAEFERRVHEVNRSRGEIEACKRRHDAMLVSGDYTSLRYYILFLRDPPEFACTGTMVPTHDFAGRSIQAPIRPHRPTEHVHVSIIPCETGGAVVLSWIGDKTAPYRFVHSLDTIPEGCLPDAVVRLAYEYFSNTYASPRWWVSLTSAQQQRLIHRTGSSLLRPRVSTCLVDDGFVFVNWTIKRRATNLW